MIYRCTAHFLQAFDALDARGQALVMKAMRGFAEAPRLPSRDVRPVQETRVWVLPCGSDLHLTYSFISEEEEPDHFICVLRNVGTV